MKRRIVAAVSSVLLVIGCTARTEPAAAVVTTPEVTDATDATDIAAPPGETVEMQMATSSLVGKYYRGDGLGFNLHLTLKRKGTFECTWTGCLGVYGKCSGTWTLKENEIHIQTKTADGMFDRSPLGSFQVTQREGKTIFIDSSDKEFFEKWGPSRYACFHREDQIPDY